MKSAKAMLSLRKLPSETAGGESPIVSRKNPAFLRKSVAVVLLGAMAFGLNIHLVAMQFYAWSDMTLESHRETGSLSAALEQTFSGRTPCDVCRQVETALKPAENTSEKTFAGFSWLLLLPVRTSLQVSPPSSSKAPVALIPLKPDSRAHAPEAPPPRAVTG